MNKHFLFERQIAVATLHGKEKFIEPLFLKEFNASCIVPEGLNTDLFGTFSGEIEREADPLTTAKKKCVKALELSGLDIAIASEGSFGPHPSFYFCPANTEIVLLLDNKNNFEFTAFEISTHTNFKGGQVKNEEELLSFADSVLFPSHFLILRKDVSSKNDIIKGINTHDDLLNAYSYLKRKYGSVYVETDMRAMHNPSRRVVIEKAVQKLIEKIKSVCPNCETPGYAVTEIKQGLKCGQCGMPTKSALSHKYTCQKCHFHENKMYPNQQLSEDPMYCDFCNP